MLQPFAITETAGHVFARSHVQMYRCDEPARDPVPLPQSCEVCDMQPTGRIVGDAVHVLDPCPYPNGITTEITINVPSGKIIVADDLRPVFKWDDSTMARYGTTIGQAQAIKAMAAIGCAYGPAYNCGLGLWRTGPDSYIIANPAYSEEDDEPSILGATLLAKICTDLWAYSIADYDHWLSQGGDPHQLSWADTIVDVTPGTYRFTHHSGERGFDHEGADDVIYAHVERIA
jgi:hypothetical protein